MIRFFAAGDIVVGYRPFSYTINEGAENVTLTIVVLSHPRIGAPRPFTLVVSTQNGTASMCPSINLFLLFFILNTIQLLQMVTMNQ